MFPTTEWRLKTFSTFKTGMPWKEFFWWL